jgi:prolyl oligopeptidase PreP (S9A serine peptidase family)
MTSVSKDGRYIAYGKAEGGSDWQTFHIREIESGEDTDDFLEWIKYSPAAWTRDGCRLLLQPLSGAGRRSADRAQPGSPALLPPHG